MLREVKCRHLRPRLVPFRATTSNVAANTLINIGAGDLTLSRASSGVFTLTNRMGFSRNGFFLGTTDNQNPGDGAYVSYGATTGTSSAFIINTFDSAGNATDGRTDGIFFGFDSTDANLVRPQNVDCSRNYSRINFGKVTGATGAVTIGTRDFSCTRSATGTYTVTFLRAYAQTPVVLASPISTAATAVANITSNISARPGNSIGLKTLDETGTPQDYDFYLLVVGQDSRSDSGRNHYPLQCSQRKPRIVACQITNTAGTPTLTIGGATGGADFTTLTDNGAGDFSVTIAEPFKREPAIFVMTSSQRSQVHSYSNNIIRVLTKNALGVNTDVSGVTHILAVGSDDATEF